MPYLTFHKNKDFQLDSNYYFSIINAQSKYLTAFVPEALVAAMPQREASAPGSIGNQRPVSRNDLNID